MSDAAPLDADRLPRHIAIVMDGNGRWAKSRRKPRIYGHKVGADSVREIVEMSREIGIGHLTLYAFSSENWNRPEQEVSGLMNILKSYLISELSRMEKNEIRLNCLGETSRLPDGVRRTLEDTINRTAGNDKMVLNLALSYGARDEICLAVKHLARRCLEKKLKPEQIDHRIFSEQLYTAGQPDPDLLIRTGGEQRLSNFLLWQAAYSEIYISQTLWPDFSETEFLDILKNFQNRDRRFGKVACSTSNDG